MTARTSVSAPLRSAFFPLSRSASSTTGSPPGRPPPVRSTAQDPASSAPSTPPQQDFLDLNNLPTSPSVRTSRPPSPSPTQASNADPNLESSINQLHISSAGSDATGPATVSSPAAMSAKYKPTDRSYHPHVIRPTAGSLTALQLHRLLTLHALGRGEGWAEVGRLAERFGVEEAKVRRLVGNVAVARLFEVGGGGRNEAPETVGVKDAADVPLGKQVRVQGHHLVQHLHTLEEERSRGGQKSSA